MIHCRFFAILLHGQMIIESYITHLLLVFRSRKVFTRSVCHNSPDNLMQKKKKILSFIPRISALFPRMHHHLNNVFVSDKNAPPFFLDRHFYFHPSFYLSFYDISRVWHSSKLHLAIFETPTNLSLKRISAPPTLINLQNFINSPY